MPTTVKNMLDSKGRQVVTVDPDLQLQEIARILHDKGIGAVVVTTPQGSIAGIFTERDLVKAIAQKGADVLHEPVHARMTTSVQRCHEDQSADEVMGLMTGGRFRHVPVETEGRLAGIISIGDVVKARIREVEIESEHIKAYIAS